jgi:hypothetical protein
VKRDRRANLEERIPLGEKLIRTEPNQIMIILKGETTQYSEMEELESSVRRLRQIITYQESETDDEVFQILPLLDLLIRKFDVNANIGGKAIENKADEESIAKWIVAIQGLLKILVPRWRSQIQFLYE